MPNSTVRLFAVQPLSMRKAAAVTGHRARDRMLERLLYISSVAQYSLHIGWKGASLNT